MVPFQNQLHLLAESEERSAFTINGCLWHGTLVSRGADIEVLFPLTR